MTPDEDPHWPRDCWQPGGNICGPQAQIWNIAGIFSKHPRALDKSLQKGKIM
jgi:hypothetical protein